MTQTGDMRVQLKLVLDAPPDAVWAALRSPAVLSEVAHPFFAVTQGDGTFKITGLPPGEYEVTVLHETSIFEPTPATQSVKVAAGETQQADFAYQPRAKK